MWGDRTRLGGECRAWHAQIQDENCMVEFRKTVGYLEIKHEGIVLVIQLTRGLESLCCFPEPSAPSLGLSLNSQENSFGGGKVALFFCLTWNQLLP